MPDEETTFAQLQKRVADTLAYIQSVDPKAFDGSEDRTVELKLPGGTLTFTGEDYLLGLRPAQLLLPRGHRLRRAAPQGRADRQAGLSGAGSGLRSLRAPLRCHPGKRAALVRDPGEPQRICPVPGSRTAPAWLPG